MAQDTSSFNNTIALDDYVLLGHTGLRVSPLCLGTMTFGESWGIGTNSDESKKVFDYYYEKGGNFFDTANTYNFGESERFLGDYVSDKRSNVVIASKYTTNETTMLSENRYNPDGISVKPKYNPNAGGNHRKSLVENLDASLKRLNMSYLDILYVHIYEYRTPIEEIMRSLDDVVRSGKALYIAVSDIPSWAITRANTIAELRGWSRFIALQTRYNLLDRSMEFDLQPACAELDVGIIPWGIVAEGFLTGKYTRESNAEGKNMRIQSVLHSSNAEKNWKILDEVIAISKEIGRSPVQVATNWVQQKPGVTSPLIGARTVDQLEENLKSLEFRLTPEQMKRLDEVSKPLPSETPFPHGIYGALNQTIGKNIEMPKKFESIAVSYNFGTLSRHKS